MDTPKERYMKSSTSGTNAKPRGSHARLSSLPLGAVKARGWLARQMWVEANRMSGHMVPMEVKTLEVKDWTLSKKRPLAVERGPLLFSLPIKTEWKAIPGSPLTPLPPDWSWFDAYPVTKKIAGEERLAWLCSKVSQLAVGATVGNSLFAAARPIQRQAGAVRG